MKGITYAIISESQFYDRLHDFLHSFSFSVMADKGYSIVCGISEFKDFHALFCWTPPTLIEVAHAVTFLCMY